MAFEPNIVRMLTLKSSSEIAIELAGRLRERRLQKEWTQAELAKRAGIAPATYIHFERTGQIAFHRLIQVFTVLGLVGEIEALARQTDITNLRMDEILKPKRIRGKRQK